MGDYLFEAVTVSVIADLADICNAVTTPGNTEADLDRLKQRMDVVVADVTHLRDRFVKAKT